MTSIDVDVLYEDKYCKLTVSELIIKRYYLPTAQSKHIDIASIRCIYYASQQMFYRQAFVAKSWGMAFSPIWWACDIGR